MLQCRSLSDLHLEVLQKLGEMSELGYLLHDFFKDNLNFHSGLLFLSLAKNLQDFLNQKQLSLVYLKGNQLFIRPGN